MSPTPSTHANLAEAAGGAGAGPFARRRNAFGLHGPARAAADEYAPPGEETRVDPEASAEVARLEQAFGQARGEFGQAGAFLFGDFSAADAMFAPVVNRLHVYKVAVTPGTRAYIDAMMALPVWQDWSAQAQAETWIIDKYEAA
jgi:glutathione S-transferase